MPSMHNDASIFLFLFVPRFAIVFAHINLQIAIRAHGDLFEVRMSSIILSGKTNMYHSPREKTREFFLRASKFVHASRTRTKLTGEYRCFRSGVSTCFSIRRHMRSLITKYITITYQEREKDEKCRKAEMSS